MKVKLHSRMSLLILYRNILRFNNQYLFQNHLGLSLNIPLIPASQIRTKSVDFLAFSAVERRTGINELPGYPNGESGRAFI